MKKIAQKILIPLLFLVVLGNSISNAQISVNAIELYNCLGRLDSDPLVIQFAQKFGKPDTIVKGDYYWDVRYPCGITIIYRLKDREFYSITWNTVQYQGKLPFGLAPHLTVTELENKIPKDKDAVDYLVNRHYYMAISGEAIVKEDRSIQSLTLWNPSSYCLTRDSVFKAIDQTAQKPKAGETDADFQKRLATEEQKLLDFLLLKYEKLVDAERKKRTELKETPIAQFKPTIGKYDNYAERFPVTLNLEDRQHKMLVRVPKAKASEFQARFLLAKVNTKRGWDNSFCRMGPTRVNFILLDGQKYTDY